MRLSRHLLSAAMTSKPKMNVHDFPRPPLLEKIPRHLVIKWKSVTPLEPIRVPGTLAVCRWNALSENI